MVGTDGQQAVQTLPEFLEDQQPCHFDKPINYNQTQFKPCDVATSLLLATAVLEPQTRQVCKDTETRKAQ